MDKLMNKKEYDQKRYFTKIRPQIFGDRRCLACTVLLKGKYGAKNSGKYCGDCVRTGAATRHQKRLYYKKNRRRILARVKAYAATYPDYKKQYLKQWAEKNKKRVRKYKQEWKVRKRLEAKEVNNENN